MKHLFTLATVAAAAVLLGIAACGGEERRSREELGDRLQSIDRRGSELWARLAQGARDLQPNEPIPTDVRQVLTELVAFQKQTVTELAELEGDEANKPVELLAEALSERTDTLEHVIGAGRFTQEDFDRVTRSGDKIDRAFAQLRDEGILPAVEEHD